MNENTMCVLDTVESIFQALNADQKGELLRIMVEVNDSGKEPEIQDELIRVAWKGIKYTMRIYEVDLFDVLLEMFNGGGFNEY